MTRPSASVLSISAVLPLRNRTMSPGLYDEPEGRFSVSAAIPTRLTSRRRSAAARTAPIAVAAPIMSHFMSPILSAGLIEISPESNVTPFPTSATGASPFPPPRYSRTTTRGSSAAPRFTARRPPILSFRIAFLSRTVTFPPRTFASFRTRSAKSRGSMSFDGVLPRSSRDAFLAWACPGRFADGAARYWHAGDLSPGCGMALERNLAARTQGEGVPRRLEEAPEEQALGNAGVSRMRLVSVADSTPVTHAGFKVYLLRVSTLQPRGGSYALGWKQIPRGAVDGSRPDDSTPIFAEMAPPGFTFEGNWQEKTFFTQPEIRRVIRWQESFDRSRIFEAANDYAARLLAAHKQYATWTGLDLLARQNRAPSKWRI